jgi:plasmid maintenance system antidote protein VapI
MPDPVTMTALLRQRIRSGGETIYAIAKAAGIEPASLRRFASGRQSLRLDVADRLAAHFGLRLTQTKRK